MKFSDLAEVNRLTALLKERTSEHESLKSMLMRDGGKFGLPHQVEMRIGGDMYGNGSYKTVRMDLVDCREAVKIISKDIDIAWGKIVMIRAKLREFGVDL